MPGRPSAAAACVSASAGHSPSHPRFSHAVATPATPVAGASELRGLGRGLRADTGGHEDAPVSRPVRARTRVRSPITTHPLWATYGTDSLARRPAPGRICPTSRVREFTGTCNRRLGTVCGPASTPGDVSGSEAPAALLLARSAHPGMVGRAVVAITGLKHLPSLGGIYARPRATGEMRGPAFMPREISWLRSVAPCCSSDPSI